MREQGLPGRCSCRTQAAELVRSDPAAAQYRWALIVACGRTYEPA